MCAGTAKQQSRGLPAALVRPDETGERGALRVARVSLVPAAHPVSDLGDSTTGIPDLLLKPRRDRVERFGLFHERPERLDRKAPRLHALNSSLGATIPRPIYPAGLRSGLRYPRRTSSRITTTVTITTTPRIKPTGGPERAGLVYYAVGNGNQKAPVR